MMKYLLLAVFSVSVVLAALPIDLDSPQCVGDCLLGDENSIMSIKNPMQIKMDQRRDSHLLGTCPMSSLKKLSAVPCVDGKAGEYPCKDVDLVSFVPLASLTGSSLSEGNDCWGWTDANGREIAIMALTDGSSFVDISEPTNPVVLGFLPSAQPGNVIWRDIKVYKDHAFIGSEHKNHGMQVFDLTKLPTRAEAVNDVAPRKLVADALYTSFGSSHNIVINEESGFAYAVGTTTCRGALHAVDIREPKNPKFAGCQGSEDGYTHDAQVVIYHGVDTRYHGHEISFSFNEDSLTIFDVSEKTAPVMLSRVMYEGYAYSHQGWLTADQKYLLLDDELDEVEQKNDGRTRTFVWNVEDLKNPRLINSYHSPATAIDHNQYILGDLSYQANYEAGLRILNITNIAEGKLTEQGFFDVRPESTAVEFFGSWSTYPYFKSGVVVVSSIERGLFLVKPNFQPNRAAFAPLDTVVRAVAEAKTE